MSNKTEAMTVTEPGEAYPRRTTWFMEFGSIKSAQIIITGELDDEVIEAMMDYLGRKQARLATARADAQ